MVEGHEHDARRRHRRARQGPLRWLGPLLALTCTTQLTTLPSGVLEGLHHALVIAVIAASGWLCVRGVRVVEDVVTQHFDVSSANNLHARAVFTQMRGFRNITTFAVLVATLGFALMTFEKVRELGTGLLASAGVAGIVVGFAAQKSIATVLAGVQIAITQPIRVDDVVIVEGEWGRIEEITLTYVVVKIWDLRRLILPITYFIEKPFQNWTRTEANLLGTVELHLDYSVPVDAIRREFQRVLDESELWDRQTCGVQITDSTERAIVVRLLMSARDASVAWDLRCEVREKLVLFVQRQYPFALPRIRGEIAGPRTASEQGAGKRPPAREGEATASAG